MKGVSPLARAVRTKSEESATSMDARVVRAIGASEKIASVSAGSISCLSAREEELAISGNCTVDEIEARHIKRRTEKHIEAAERRGASPRR